MAPLRFANASSSNKGIPDEFIVALLTDRLEIAPGVPTPWVKEFLDKLEADGSDHDFCKSPDARAQFHDDLADLLTARLKIHAKGVSPKATEFLQDVKRSFIEQVEQNKAVSRAAFHAMDTQSRKAFSSGEFRGLSVPSKQGGKLDLLERSTSQLRANFTMQREGVGSFLHWSSTKYISARSRDEQPTLTQRIYLNPKATDAVKIFAEIIDAAEAHGLTVKAKIWHRSLEASKQLTQPDQHFALRGDGIVLCAGDDADRLLALVEAVQRKHHASFAGRRTSRVPLRVGEGVAVGSEPESGESLTTHRTTLINGAASATHQAMPQLKQEIAMPQGRARAIQTFRQMFQKECAQRGVNPNNLAFNAQQTTRSAAMQLT